jgi:wyosine [tRNA(Phe)-imidazoG37] synthetase (radical SAM superfamily)
MSTFLFDSIIFGPVASRRLGKSLGINLLPINKKICNFNCIYCECGLTGDTNTNSKLPDRYEVINALEKWLQNNQNVMNPVDSITFAGNGEPTLHPQFDKIIEDTISLRNKYFSNLKIAVLSNATTISKKRVFNALLKTDLNILKLDSGFEKTIKAINCPLIKFDLDTIIGLLKKFKGKLIIQTLFFKGKINNKIIDNTTPEEVEKWLDTIDMIQPESIMIYTIARETPFKGLEKAEYNVLQSIASKAKKRGHIVQISA